MFSPLPGINSSTHNNRPMFWSINRDDESPLRTRNQTNAVSNGGRSSQMIRSFNLGSVDNRAMHSQQEINSMFNPPSVNRYFV